MLGIWKNRKLRRQADFERLCLMMVESRAKDIAKSDFGHMCSMFKTSAVTLDNMMYDAFGMSGDELLARLRRKKPDIQY